MKRNGILITFLFVCVLGANAQSWLDIFSSDKINKATKVISDVTGVSTSRDLKGSWRYEGAAIQLKSDDALKQIGGALATSTLEGKLNERLKSLGINPGELTFTFHTDSTFTSTLQGKKLNGTYTYYPEKQQISFKYAQLINMDAKVNQSSQYVSILYDADKVLALLTTLSGMTNNQSLQAIGSLLNSYDGMLMGLKLKKVGSAK